MDLLFPFQQYAWFYVIFVAAVLGLLVLDLGLFHKKAREMPFKEAMTWTVVWISLAFLFNIGLYYYLHEVRGLPLEAKKISLEFLTGFIIEKSLAVDNIFLFTIVFQYFAVAPEYRHRILFMGILGALVLRSIFIALGTQLLAIKWVAILFGVILLATGVKVIFSHSQAVDLSQSRIIKLLNRIFQVDQGYLGPKFFLKKDGKYFVTRSFLALMFLEIVDLIFAIDSVPAIFSVTAEPLVVFTSNIFAILGLRSMYFMLDSVVNRFKYVKFGLGFILVFVGLKMAVLNELFGGKFPIVWSLAIILGILALSIVWSLKASEKSVVGSD